MSLWMCIWPICSGLLQRGVLKYLGLLWKLKMAEGFYLSDDNPDIPIELRSVVGAVFTLFTNRQLHYQLCASEAEAAA